MAAPTSHVDRAHEDEVNRRDRGSEAESVEPGLSNPSPADKPFQSIYAKVLNHGNEHLGLHCP